MFDKQNYVVPTKPYNSGHETVRADDIMFRDAPEAMGDEPDDADFDVPCIYEPIESFEQLETRLIYFMEQYNESVRGAFLDMVFFRDAMIHLVKVPHVNPTHKATIY